MTEIQKCSEKNPGYGNYGMVILILLLTIKLNGNKMYLVFKKLLIILKNF